MAGRKLIVIVDGDEAGQAHAAEWQRRALATLPSGDELTLLVCTNTRLRRRPGKHAAYYALNLLSVRNPLTRMAPLDGIAAPIVARHTFASGYDGAWQVLPDQIVDLIAASGAAAAIKLGMGLMRVPARLKLPILSWHHGDPRRFRGRPAGFWEIAGGWPVMGQMVQVIGNKLDAGAVVAFAETRISRHSWRATLIESFRHSPLLLAPALDAALAGRTLDIAPEGRNYRLPSNLQTAGFALRMAGQWLRRGLYGGLFEKAWRVSIAPVSGAAQAAAILRGEAAMPDPAHWRTPPVPPGCTFVADPFFAANGRDLLVEALSASSGRGEIHRIDPDGVTTRLSAEPGHFSYPAVVDHAGEALVVPEIAQWSTPTIYRQTPAWERVATVDIDGSPPLSDPTLFRHKGRIYLFGNLLDDGSGVLRLWHAADLFGRFVEHPASPVRIGPRGSRMGGNLVETGGRILRIGQDFTRDYGDGLVVFEVEALDSTTYREREIGLLKLPGRSGPHTFNLSPDGSRIVFDWYREAFSPMAGLRRLRARLRRS